MVNAQLERLNRSMLEHLRPDQACLVTEPLSMSRKRLEKMEVGDWIDLGSEAPEFTVRQGTKTLYAARLRAGERGEEILLAGPGPEPLPERPGKKRIVLEGRLAILPAGRLQRGAILDFPWRLSEHIHLFAGGEWVAAAKLIGHPGGYALKITERAE